MIRFLLSVLILTSMSCSYRVGQVDKRIPGGYDLISVPVFKNKTKMAAAETYFTNALILEMERSRLAHKASPQVAQASLEGVVERVEVVRGTEVDRDTEGFSNLPMEAVLSKEFRIRVVTGLTLRKNSDKKILWQGVFTGERRYPAPVVIEQTLNTVNPLYNHSAQYQQIEILAKDMMEEAFEQMTENF